MGKNFPINTKDSNFFAADNLITFGKVLGFLKENDFVEFAEKSFSDDDFHKSIIWRIHILSWSMKQCFRIKGDFNVGRSCKGVYRFQKLNHRKLPKARNGATPS